MNARFLPEIHSYFFWWASGPPWGEETYEDTSRSGRGRSPLHPHLGVDVSFLPLDKLIIFL